MADARTGKDCTIMHNNARESELFFQHIEKVLRALRYLPRFGEGAVPPHDRLPVTGKQQLARGVALRDVFPAALHGHKSSALYQQP